MKKTLLLLLSLSFICYETLAQGETCATAVTVVPGNTYNADGPSTGNGASFPGDIHADWYKFNFAENTVVEISSCDETNDDTYLTLHSGDCANLIYLGEYDDECGSGEKAILSAQANTTYYIEWSDSYDTSPFTWTFSEVTSEVTIGGETCAEAVDVSIGSYISDGPTSGNGAVGSGDNADWFKYTSTIDESITISSCGSDIDSRLLVYDGNCNSLNELSDNDDDCDINEEATIVMTAGQTIYFEWTDTYSISAVEFNVTGTISAVNSSLLEQQISIFPNPTNGLFNINYGTINESDIESVRLFNAMGKEIINVTPGESIDLSSDEKGVYLLHISSGNNTIVKKIIKN